MVTKKVSDFEKDLGRTSGKTKNPPKPHAKEPPPQLRGKKKDDR